MGHPQIAAFARLADGAANPTRIIAGQKTFLARTTHAVTYDSIHDEIVIVQNIGQAILTYRGAADGDESPIRKIQGPSTQLRGPHRHDVDPIHNEIFVPEEGRILVFPRDGNGDVAPIRILEGPYTSAGTSAVAVDPVHDLLIVPRDRSLLIFNRTDEGNAKPKAIIQGPKTGLGGASNMRVYPPKGLILVAARGPNSRPRDSDDNYVGVWSIHDNGDVPPRWTIGGPEGMLRQVRGVDLDPKNKSVIISDKHLNAVLTYYFPEIF
ncbi:MAG: hypothetical protein HY647_00820 [Acidobacteria bacterium]|nr:hypothetical protein [Acidobacteriota bacterium]